MSTEDILKMSGEIRRISNEECRLWFWTTKDFLEESFQIIREFGFEFRQILTWVKTNKKGQPSYGMGYYFRNTTEFLLYATNKKGLRPLQATTASNVLFAPREGHSRKPDVFYQFIKDNSEEPRVSLFQRTKRDGFHVWGNEMLENI
jgi:site-specific DNA-methyltransferase (adenine-specific)